MSSFFDVLIFDLVWGWVLNKGRMNVPQLPGSDHGEKMD